MGIVAAAPVTVLVAGGLLLGYGLSVGYDAVFGEGKDNVITNAVANLLK